MPAIVIALPKHPDLAAAAVMLEAGRGASS
jgi:hypothetical protein